MVQILPTDTCYGLAWEFTSEDYQEIYWLKGRDFSKPLAFVVENFEDMKKYIQISNREIEFLKKYPHPWSFLGKRNPDFMLPDFLDETQYSKISLRVGKIVLKNYQGSYPLFLTSANPSGQKEAQNFKEAKSYFPQIDGIDGGVCDQKPSDIFSISENGEIIYLRKNY